MALGTINVRGCASFFSMQGETKSHQLAIGTDQLVNAKKWVGHQSYTPADSPVIFHIKYFDMMSCKANDPNDQTIYPSVVRIIIHHCQVVSFYILCLFIHAPLRRNHKKIQWCCACSAWL